MTRPVDPAVVDLLALLLVRAYQRRQQQRVVVEPIAVPVTDPSPPNGDTRDA
jgi:hypothetical protein